MSTASLGNKYILAEMKSEHVKAVRSIANDATKNNPSHKNKSIELLPKVEPPKWTNAVLDKVVMSDFSVTDEASKSLTDFDHGKSFALENASVSQRTDALTELAELCGDSGKDARKELDRRKANMMEFCTEPEPKDSRP